MIKQVKKKKEQVSDSVALSKQSVPKQSVSQQSYSRVMPKKEAVSKRFGSQRQATTQQNSRTGSYSQARQSKDWKWYTGETPTARETYAQMYRTANGDRAKFQELEGMYAKERSTIGSPIYNPYTEATNYKAIQGLADLGIDMSGGVTQEWLNQNIGLLGDKRTTTTGYNAAAPTKKSSAAENAAYWYQTLQNAEERTQAAENEMSQLATDVKYLAERGYSDKAIIEKIRRDFDSNYKTLSKMDEERNAGSALILNRPVDYSGDDTLYGMIWAARNNDQSGDYFTDAVRYTLGQGNKYQYNAASEAARDPSNYEGYHPYSMGSTVEDWNKLTGSNKIDDATLEANRSMLAGTDEQIKAWQNAYEANENSKQATAQLAALDEWAQKQIERGKSADEIISMLDSYIDPADGNASSDYATLAKMEKARKMGSYLPVGDSIDFTLPQYREKIRAEVQQRDDEAAQAAEEQATKDGVASGWNAFWTGSVGEESDKILKSKNPDTKGSLHEYIRENYGVDVDDFTDEELEQWESALGKARDAQRMGVTSGSGQAREDAEFSAVEAAKMAKGIAESDRAHEYKAEEHAKEETQAVPAAAQANVDTSMLADVVPKAVAPAYDPKKSIAYASVYGSGEEQREGMADMNAAPQRYEIGAGGGGEPEVKRGSEDATPRSQESEDYLAMCSGGQWNSTAYAWALNKSTNPDGLRAELINGIEQIRRGNLAPDEAGLAGSWYNEFEHLFSGYDTQWVATNSIMGASQRAYDPRDDYGEALGGALKSAAAAFNNGDDGALNEDEYTSIMLDLSRMTEIVDGVSENVGQRDGATSDTLVQELNLTGTIDAIQGRIDRAVQQKNAADVQATEAGYSATREALTAMFDGEPDEYQAETLSQARYTEISEAAKNDDTYGAIQDVINAGVSYDALAARGEIPTARPGLEPDAENSATAAAYSQGVKALAQTKLDQDMKYATAAGMTLEEYYQTFPKAAKTGESLMADAEREYNEAWGVDFKDGIQAILDANEKISKGETAPTQEAAQDTAEKGDGIGIYGDVSLGIGQGVRSIDRGLMSIVNNLSEPEVNSPATREILRKQYDGDAKKRREDLMAMVDAMPDVPYKEELRARIETTPDIWSIGDNKLSAWSRGQVQAADADIQSIGELVQRYGTDTDKLVMQATSGVVTSTTLMATSSLASTAFVPMMGEFWGNLMGSIAAAIPEGAETTYDLRELGVDSDTAFWAGLAYTVFNGATEDLMNMGYNASAKGTYAMQEMYKQGFFKLWRANPKLAARATVATLAVKGADWLGEMTQEAVQGLGQSVIENAATGKTLISDEDLRAALDEGIAAGPSSLILGLAGGGYVEANPYIDEHGNMLSYAEAKAMPDFDGTVANNVIEHKVTQQAFQDTSTDLNALMQSSEYQAAQQARVEADTAMQQAQQVEVEAETARQQESWLTGQLQSATAEMMQADVVTKEMTDRIAEFSEALPEATSARVEAERKAAEANAAAQAAKQNADNLDAVMQTRYSEILDNAKNNAREFVLERFFHGATEEQRAAYESYLEKTAELTEAKSQLRNAKIAAEKYGAIADSKYGSAAQTAYGRALDVVDRLSSEVAELNEQADALYNVKYEQIPDEATDAKFARAEARGYAETAAQEAQADPTNVRKQMAADLAAKRLQSESAAAELVSKTADIAARLESRDSATRQAALTEYKTLVEQANTTAQATEAAQRQYDATDRTQAELNDAIADFKQYSNTDLTVEGSPKHEAAVAAYERLQNALREADIADAQNELARVTELLTADDADTQQAFTEAGNRLNELLQAKDSYTGETSAARQAAVATALQNGGLEQLQQAINSRERAEVVQALNSIATESQENARALRTLAGIQDTTAQLTVKGDTGATGQPGLTRAYAESSVKLSADQNTQMQILNAFAKDANIEIVVHPTVSTVEGAVNGAYIEGNVIHIGLDAIDQGYVQAGFHETVHWIAQNAQANPDAYSGLEQTVFDALRENGADIDSLVRQRVEQYAQNGVNISEQAAREEIVAESCGMVLTDEANMLKFAQEHKSAFQAVMDGFVRFWEKLKSIAASIGNKNQRAEMQTLLGKDSALQKIYDNFMAAAKETGSTIIDPQIQEEAAQSYEFDASETMQNMQQRDTESAINYLAGQLVDNGPRAAEIAKALSGMRQTEATGRATPGIQRDMGIFRRDRNAAPQQGQRGDVQNPIQIMRDLTDSIQVGYNPGGQMSANGARVDRNVMGFYNQRARAITTRTNEAGDMATGLHEFGHAAQARLPELHANDAMINALPATFRQNYAQAELDGEAVAEFVVDYMYGRDRAVATAGEEYVRDFERQMRAVPDLLRAVTRGREQVRQWSEADTGAKIRSMMSETSTYKQRRGGISNLLSEINRQVFDYMAPAKQVSDELYEAAQWSASASKRADVVLTQNLIDPEGNIAGESLSQRLADAGATQEMYRDIAEFALARHAIDRDRAGKPVFDTHEITAQDLQDYVVNTETNHPEIVRAADALVDFWKDFFDVWMVETGMVDQQTVDTMRQMYPNYVPTFRVTDKNFGKQNGAGSTFRLRAAVQGGSSLEVINPIYSITRMTQQIVNTVSQNQVMRVFHDAMQGGDFGWLATQETADMRVTNVDTGRAEFALADLYENLAASGAEIDPMAFEDFYDTLANMRQNWTNTGWNRDANIVSGVDEDGRRFFYKIKDKGMYELLSGSANTMVLGSKLIVNAKNAFTRLTTSSNPFFALKNAARDFQVSVNTGTWAVTYVDGAVKWARAFHEALHKSSTFVEWRNMGGGEHTRLSSETGAKARQLVDTLFQSQRRVTPSKIKDALIQTMTLEQFNNLIENTSRYAEYRFGRHDTSTFEGRREAFMASQDVTTNFATHGANAILRGVNRIVPFYNATMQGLSKDINIIRNAFNRDGSVRTRSWEAIGKTALNVGLTAALQAALIGAFSGGDDDDRTKEEYGMLSEEMRAGNLIIPIPKWLIGNSGFDRPYVRIPIAQGPLTRSIYAAGLQLMSDVANMDEMSVDMYRTAQSILQDSLPDGSIFQAVIDAKYNRTWYGSNIVSSYALKRSVPNQYNNDTLELFKGFSKLLYGRGIEVSPAVMQYVAEQYSGFAGKLIMPLLSGNRYTGERSIGQSLRNVGYSILKNYTIDPLTSTDLTNDYKTAKSTMDAIKYDSDNGDPVLALSDLLTDSEREEAIDRAKALQAKGGAFYDADREIKDLWADMSNIQKSSLSDAEKMQQIREIRYDIDKTMEAALADWEEYKMYYIDHDTLAIAATNAIRKGRS